MTRWMLTAAVAVALGGCERFKFATIDEACPDQLAGEVKLAPGTSDMLARFACYRRFEGLQMPRITQPAQNAIEAHAHYLDVNEVLDPESPKAAQTVSDYFTERKDWPGFTGVNAIERLKHFEAIDNTGSIGVWDVLLPDGGAEVADSNVADPYTRDVVFQPLWYTVGYAVVPAPVQDAGYFSAVYAMPPSKNVYHPIVYPRDGQIDVPTTYVTYGIESDPLSVQPYIGFPITVTVGAFQVGRDGANPYDLQPVSATLTGEEGDIQLVVVPPGNFPWGPMQGTIIYAPYEPLQPGRTYDFEAKIRWLDFPDGKTVTATFTTASE